MLALIFALVSVAVPYETDPVTGRTRPLRDASPQANRHMNQLIDDAVAATNQRLGCGRDFQQVQRVLAREIHGFAAGLTRVPGRGVLQGFGHSAVSAYLESADIDRIAFDDRGDIYEDLQVFRAPVLATAGPCSTIRVGDVRVGTDKLYHFVDEGHDYYQRSRAGTLPDRALLWGHLAESTVYGMWTSDAYSYADLRANWDGYLFYSGLLGPGSVVSMDSQGCVARTRDFDWRDWVDQEYDELYNPPVYSRAVLAALPEALQGRTVELCVEPVVPPDGERPGYVHRYAPVQVDVWSQAGRCEDP